MGGRGVGSVEIWEFGGRAMFRIRRTLEAGYRELRCRGNSAACWGVVALVALVELMMALLADVAPDQVR